MFRFSIRDVIWLTVMAIANLAHSEDVVEQPLAEKELSAALESVSNAISANTNRITTWSGDYTLLLFADSRDDLRAKLKLEPLNAKIAEAYQGEFELDRPSNKVFSTRRHVGSAAYKVGIAGDGSVGTLPTDKSETSFILAGIEFLHKNSRNREIFREHRRIGEQRTRYADVFDPKQLLGHHSLGFDKMFTNFGLLLKKENRTSKFVGYQTRSEDTQQYRFVQTFADGLILDCTVDSKYGFNATTYSLRLKDITSEEVRLAYSFSGGVYLPLSYHLVKRDRFDKLSQERQVDITSSRLNVPLADEGFSVKRFKPVEGDRLNDRIDNKIKVYSGDMFVSP